MSIKTFYTLIRNPWCGYEYTSMTEAIFDIRRDRTEESRFYFELNENDQCDNNVTMVTM